MIVVWCGRTLSFEFGPASNISLQGQFVKVQIFFWEMAATDDGDPLGRAAHRRAGA
jgi:hypothetical protein